MAATVTIRRWTGTSGAPTKTNITSINTRANAEDAHSTAGTTNSILIPAAGTSQSFWVNTRLSVDAITGGTVNNLRWYTDGANNFGTGVTCVAAPANVYAQAVGTVGTSGTALTLANYGNGTSDLAPKDNTGATVAAPVDAFTFTSGAPLTLTGTTSATGDVGQFLVYQIVVGTTATSGASGSETFTYKYDDTSS